MNKIESGPNALDRPVILSATEPSYGLLLLITASQWDGWHYFA